MAIKGRFPAIRPSLDLNFAKTKRLDPRITFTRASSGTYVGRDGLIKTAGVNEARFDHNPTTGESLGLLVEEARTNLVLRSEELSTSPWTAANVTRTNNFAAAPNGSVTATKLEATTSDGIVYQSVSVSTSTNYTFSIWLRADTATPITIYLLTNGFAAIASQAVNINTSWQRLSINGNSGANAVILCAIGGGTTFSSPEVVYAWGAQLEAGAFATSYIPTTTATATRAADVASITGTNFSSWYRQDEGTVFVDNTNYGVSNTRIVSFSDNSQSNRFTVARGTGLSGNINTTVTISGVAQVNSLVLASSLSFGSAAKAAVAIKASDFAGSANGLAPVTQATGSTPTTLSQVTIGNGETLGANTFAGTIRRLAYWPQRLSNATLQALTS